MRNSSETDADPAGNGTEAPDRERRVADQLADLDLTPKQLTYLEHRMAGATVTDAADAAGVARSTPYNWRDKVDFRAARKLLEQDRLQEFLRRVDRVEGKALETVEEAVSSGDKQLAFRVLKETGGLTQGARGRSPSTLDRVRAEVKSDLEIDNLVM